MFSRLWPLVIAVALLGGCTLERKREPMLADTTGSLFARDGNRFEVDPVEKGRLHYRNQDYGNAEKYFRLAVERDPRNMDAWLGLAASYDRLRRFDMAQRAYGVIIEKAGYTASVHNNLGYHYYLRGDMAKARHHYEAARAMDPASVTVQNNLKLLKPS
ncbi:MAG: tetratricopeptide repeat protein [Hyphomicrobiales bacterium]